MYKWMISLIRGMRLRWHCSDWRLCSARFLCSRGESPITKHLLITKHFPTFSSFLNQIDWLLCHCICKLKGSKCSFSVRSKGATQKTQEKDEWVCFQKFEKIAIDSFLVPDSCLPHFQSVSDWFKTWSVCQLGLYKTCLCSTGKDARTKYFKLNFLICFNSPIIKHWTPFHPQSFPILPHSFTALSNFWSIGSAMWRAGNILLNLEAEEQCVRIWPPSTS